MKPRLVALLLLAITLLLVGMIPAVGAQPATPTPERPPQLARPADAPARQRPVAPALDASQAQADRPVDERRLERDPEYARQMEREMSRQTAAPPALPQQAGPPSGYPDPEPEPGTAVIRASVDPMGEDANSFSYYPDITPDGRYVAFQSYADDLVPGDWNEAWDIFVRDTQTNATERVSVATGGDEADSDSYAPSISADGRYVVFHSWADNLVDDDSNWSDDIFLHDRQTGETTLISRHSDGTQGDSDSYDPAISADGRYVVFYSWADNLVDDDSNWSNDIFLHDRQTGETTLISRHNDGTQGNNYSYNPAISADGQFVAYNSQADNLVDDDFNGTGDVFLHDTSTGETTLISRHSDGTQGNSESYEPVISTGGQFVAYTSFADNLVDDDFNGTDDVFLHDTSTGETTLISRHSDGTQGSFGSYRPAISGDGQFVAYYSYADNLINDDANGTVADVFLYDVQNELTTLVSKSVTGEQGSWYSSSPAVNGDGSVIAFESGAYNLVPFDWNLYTRDIFVRYTGQANLHAISGRVTDENSDGLGWVIVRDISGAAVEADEFGDYMLSTLLPGDHGVWAYDGYYTNFPTTPEWVTLPPDATNVDIMGQTNDEYYAGYWASADAYVDEAKKTKNYGTLPYLRVKNASKDMNTYLKFDVFGLGTCAQVDWSYITLFATDGGPDGGGLYATGNDWTETGITWNNAPTLGGQQDWGSAVSNNATVNLYPYNITGNGTYSYALRNDSSDQVQYDSRSGANAMALRVYWYQGQERTLDAEFGMYVSSHLTPAIVQFTDATIGCPTSWHWDFGDGYTSTDQNPTHTYTTPGYYPVVLTVTNSLGTDKKTYWIEVYEPPSKFYMSLSKKLTVGGIVAEPADIVLYDKSANTWQMVYDGSDHGTKANISSFTWDGDDLLIVFSGSQTITGLGKATQYDVVRFTPNTPGVFPLGPGVFDWVFQGKPNGLTKGTEKIDALGYQWWGNLLMSTTGKADLPTSPVLKTDKEDLLGWYRGDQQWADYLYLDGSQIPGMAGKNVNGVWYDEWADEYYVIIAGKFDLGGGVAGNDANIVRLSWSNGQWTPSLVNWLAPGAPAFKGKIDAIEMSR